METQPKATAKEPSALFGAALWALKDHWPISQDHLRSQMTTCNTITFQNLTWQSRLSFKNIRSKPRKFPNSSPNLDGCVTFFQASFRQILLRSLLISSRRAGRRSKTALGALEETTLGWARLGEVGTLLHQLKLRTCVACSDQLLQFNWLPKDRSGLRFCTLKLTAYYFQ